MADSPLKPQRQVDRSLKAWLFVLSTVVGGLIALAGAVAAIRAAWKGGS